MWAGLTLTCTYSTCLVPRLLEPARDFIHGYGMYLYLIWLQPSERGLSQAHHPAHEDGTVQRVNILSSYMYLRTFLLLQSQKIKGLGALLQKSFDHYFSHL